ncbi:uracil-DNA glycosylase family protein [Streptosporangium lutulentum]
MTHVPPGSGWPDDPARPDTPVAHDPAEVRELASASRTLAELTAAQSVCRACPRLVEWREEVATVKRRAFAGETYWGRPIAGWGEERPEVLIVGLAPAAHGGNRTGRIFTGDRSGDWLFASLHRTGLAAQETSVRAGDGQRLVGARMVAAVRCAPLPTNPSRRNGPPASPGWPGSSRWSPEAYGWWSRWGLRLAGGLASLEGRRIRPAAPEAAFGHGAEVEISHGGRPAHLLGCYHPSQQNTFTGRVTAEMLDRLFARANVLRGS